MEYMEEFELFVFSKGLKLDDIDENIINEYCSEIFYELENEDDLEKLNKLEEELRKHYLKEMK